MFRNTFKASTIIFLKEFFTSIGSNPVHSKMLRSVALIRLFFVLPLIFSFALYSFLKLKDYGYHQEAQQVIIVIWCILALAYLVLNLLLYFFNETQNFLSRILTYLIILIELATNQLVLYYYGTLASHATLFIIVIVAIYRVFLDYRFSLYAAILGGIMFTLIASLVVTGVIPISPSLPTALDHPIYNLHPAYSAQNVIQAVLIGIAIVFLSINYGMNQVFKLNRQLQEQSLTDGLTGIANRRSFEYYLSKEWNRAINNDTSLSLIMIDIDTFKLYNDNYGHVAGDDSLKKIVSVLKEGLNRECDFIARYGGEEFVILLPETNSEDAYLLAENLREKVERLGIPHAYSKVINKITVSMGVATVNPTISTDQTTLIKKADRALYHAKRSGRNKVASNKIGVGVN